MRVLAIDHGEKRIGLAVGDTEFGVATPLKTIDAGRAFEEIKALVAQERIGKIIVGMPLTLEGKRGAQAQKAVAFAAQLRATLNLPVDFFDERFTTKIAADPLVKDRDAAAAAILLQDWFDSQGLRRS